MSAPWAALQNSMVVIDYTKILVFAGVQGAGLMIPHVGFHYVNHHKAQQRLQRILDHWRNILFNLTDAQVTLLEAQEPGIVESMRQRLMQLQQRLSFLSRRIEKETWWGIAWPRTTHAADLNVLDAFIRKADDDFSTTTKALDEAYQTDPVAAVLAAEHAARSNTSIMEMATQQPESESTSSAPATDTAPENGDMSSNRGTDASLPDVPSDVAMAYRSAVATTAALLPGFLNVEGRSRPWPSPV